MKRIIVKKGDIFVAKISVTSKRYFQYITNDLKQLNSDVIRIFKTIYPQDLNPDLSEIIKDEVFLHVHCVVKLGIKHGFWKKEGNIIITETFEHLLFRDTNDYGTINGEKPIKISYNWYVWKLDDLVSTKVGKLEGENRKAEMGIIVNPLGIIELIKGNKYPVNYPDYE